MTEAFRFAELMRDALQRGRKTMRKGDRTRLALKIAATESLEHRGYNATSIDLIAKDAGVSRATFYLYFANREEVVKEVLLDYLDAVPSRAPKGNRPISAYDSILRVNRYYVGLYQMNAGLYRCMEELAYELPELARCREDLDRRWADRLLADLARRTGRDTIDVSVAYLLVTALENMTDALLRNIYEKQNPYLESFAQDRDLIAESLSFIWYRALYGENPGNVTDAGLQELASLTPKPCT